MIVCKKTIVAQDRPLCGDSNNCGVAQVGILDLVFKCSTRGTACAKVQPRGQTTLPGKIKGRLVLQQRLDSNQFRLSCV